MFSNQTEKLRAGIDGEWLKALHILGLQDL